ncbi:MAG: hypothetical protein V1902_02655 [Candidatus Falkowbacteria bacterium]
MGKSVALEQSHALMAVLAQNVDWSQLDADTIQAIIMAPRESGAQFTAFLRNRGQMVVGGSNKLTIDRSKPFDPVAFVGKGWKIGEQDERALALTEIDLAAVQLKHMLKDREPYVGGEEKLTRLKVAGYVRLDAGVFETLWNNQHLIPERWKGKIVYFDGTVLVSPDGGRYVLCIDGGGGQWSRDCGYLNHSFSGNNPSAVLAAP